MWEKHSSFTTVKIFLSDIHFNKKFSLSLKKGVREHVLKFI